MSLALNGWALAEIETEDEAGAEALSFFRCFANLYCPAGRWNPAQDEGFACSERVHTQSAYAQLLNNQEHH